MRKDAYWLINHFHNCPLSEAKDMVLVADGVQANLIEGVGVIGRLLFLAANNENAEGDINKSDLMMLGNFLENIARLQQGVTTASESLHHAITASKKGGSL